MDARVILSLMALLSTARLVTGAALPPDDALQLREDEMEEEEEEDHPGTEENDGIVTFLALLEKAEKLASSRFAAKITGVKANSKLFGKKNKMDDLREDLPNPSYHPEEPVDQPDELTDLNSMRGRHFRKVSLPKKAKKRACFWKYCIQNN